MEFNEYGFLAIIISHILHYAQCCSILHVPTFKVEIPKFSYPFEITPRNSLNTVYLFSTYWILNEYQQTLM